MELTSAFPAACFLVAVFVFGVQELSLSQTSGKWIIAITYSSVSGTLVKVNKYCVVSV